MRETLYLIGAVLVGIWLFRLLNMRKRGVDYKSILDSEEYKVKGKFES